MRCRLLLCVTKTTVGFSSAELVKKRKNLFAGLRIQVSVVIGQSTGGLKINARAMATRWRSPPDILSGGEEHGPRVQHESIALPSRQLRFWIYPEGEEAGPHSRRSKCGSRLKV